MSALSVIGSLTAGVTIFIVRFKHYNLGNLNHGSLTRYLNTCYPQLRESADLLMVDDSKLTGIAQLQKKLITQEFNKLYPRSRCHNGFLNPLEYLQCALSPISSFHLLQRRKISGWNQMD